MTTDLSDVLASVLPILLLIGLGMLLRRTSVLDEPTIAGLKRIIVSVSLPAVLFTTFLATSLRVEHLWLVVTVFAICVALLGLGRLWLVVAERRGRTVSAYAPFLFTGFELGMLGFALFTAVYGAEQLPALGVLALGHEVFIWFVYASLLRTVGHQRTSRAALWRELASSPVIIAIFAGLVLNFAGVGSWLRTSMAGGVLLATLDHLAKIIVPLVLIIIGYSSRLSWRGVRQALPLVATRLLIVVALALAVGELFFVGALGLDRSYATALMVLMVLPPPFIVPLFIPQQRRDDAQYATNVLSLYSLLSVLVFVGYVLVSQSLGVASAGS